MEALMIALMTWASTFTGMDVPEKLPRVIYADSCEIHRMYLDDGSVPCPTEDQERAVALYMHHGQTIILPDTWHPGDLYYVSVLLHELVHHMQSHDGSLEKAHQRGCKDEIERQAYDAQIAWLEAAGADAVELMQMDRFTIMVMTMCFPAPPVPYGIGNP